MTSMKPTVIVWDLETVPDLAGFAGANDLAGKSDAEVREAIGEALKPKQAIEFREQSGFCVGIMDVAGLSLSTVRALIKKLKKSSKVLKGGTYPAV
jgi:hypothetical protein